MCLAIWNEVPATITNITKRKSLENDLFNPKNNHKSSILITFLDLQHISIFEIIYQPFDLKIHLKVSLLSPKTMPKYFLNYSKTTLIKSINRLSWPPKWLKITISWAKFGQKISIFKVIYKPFELKIHPKVSLLSPKTMPKHFLNYSKTTLKKSQKRLFWAQNGQNTGGNLAKKVDFWVHFWDLSSNIAFLGLKKIVPPISWSCLKKID